MNIAILSFQTRNFENFNSVDQLAEKVIANGHDATVVRASELELRFGTSTEILLKGEPLPLFDAMIVRPRIIADPSISTTYMRALEAQGQFLVNGTDSVVFTKNKLESLRLLSDAGVPVPKTSALNSHDELDNVMKNFSFPVIVKTVYGALGTGVFYAESMKSLRPIIDFQFNRGPYNDPITIQEFIVEAKNTDIRAFVVGDKVVAAMKRTAPSNDVRANFSRGGTVERHALSPEQEELALIATRTLGMDYAGVDIINSDRGPLVLEVNSNPGFTGIGEATGVDVADSIVKLAIDKAKKSA
ncbi:MAG TPA: RimK family alpha-L-glutamate ligase [Patescibacteria group bacterium]|nr:RimK family alpha-L-glutamate ligase [Patescibacteria group bacterium]